MGTRCWGTRRLGVRAGPRGDIQAAGGIRTHRSAGHSALVVIGAFFFLAGLFVPDALARRGPRGFVLDRVCCRWLALACSVLGGICCVIAMSVTEPLGAPSGRANCPIPGSARWCCRRRRGPCRTDP